MDVNKYECGWGAGFSPLQCLRAAGLRMLKRRERRTPTIADFIRGLKNSINSQPIN
jgi:hypothetical protein